MMCVKDVSTVRCSRSSSMKNAISVKEAASRTGRSCGHSRRCPTTWKQSMRWKCRALRAATETSRLHHRSEPIMVMMMHCDHIKAGRTRKTVVVSRAASHNDLFADNLAIDRRRSRSMINDGANRRRSIQSRSASSSDAGSVSSKHDGDDECESIDDSGGDNNNNNNNNTSKSTGEDSGDNDIDEDPSSEIAAVLAAQKISTSSLPRDMQVALAKRLLSSEDIIKYAKVIQMPLLGRLATTWRPLRERLMGNERLLFTFLAEEAIGLTAKTSAEIEARKDKFWSELDFVISDLALELAGNFFLVWLLSPRRIFTSSSSGLAGFFNSLPSHASQIGSQFSMKQRCVVPLVKSGQFFCVGLGSGLIGYALTLALFQFKGDDGGEDLRPPPPFKNSLAWGSFLATSSSIRYQIVNGVEERVLDTLIKSNNVSKILSFCMRFTNCYLGGQQWVAFIRAIGIQ